MSTYFFIQKHMIFIVAQFGDAFSPPFLGYSKSDKFYSFYFYTFLMCSRFCQKTSLFFSAKKITMKNNSGFCTKMKEKNGIFCLILAKLQNAFLPYKLISSPSFLISLPPPPVPQLLPPLHATHQRPPLLFPLLSLPLLPWLLPSPRPFYPQMGSSWSCWQLPPHRQRLPRPC